MRRCPNCRRPVGPQEAICSFCDEKIVDTREDGRSGNGNQSQPGKYQNNKSNQFGDGPSPSSQTRNPGNSSARPGSGKSQAKPNQSQTGVTPPPQDGPSSNRQLGTQPPTQTSTQVSNSAPQNSGRGPRNYDATGNNKSRRGFIFGGLGLAAVLGGGAWIFMQQEEVGPDDVAKDFVKAIDDTDYETAGELIHPESPVDGASQVAELITSYAGVNALIDALDISVEETSIVEETDTEAVVNVSIVIDYALGEANGNFNLDMRTHNGDWYVWNLDESNI